MLEWIRGQQAVAVRLHGSYQWHILPKEDMPPTRKAEMDKRPKEVFPVGVLLRLRELEKQKKLWTLPDIESIAFVVFAVLLISAVFLQVTLPLGTSTEFPLWMIPIVFWMAWNIPVLLEWTLWKNRVETVRSLLRFRWFMLHVPREVWQLESLPMKAIVYLGILSIALAGCITLNFADFYWTTPAILALWARLLLSFSPFTSGAGHSLVCKAMGENNLLYLQDHILLDSFLPKRKALQAKIPLGAWLWAIVGAVFLYGGSASFLWLTNALHGYSHLEQLFLQETMHLVGLVLSLSFLVAFVRFVSKHALLHRHGFIQEINPQLQDIETWKKSSALIHHIPKMGNAPWKWMHVSAGAVLVEQGSTERKLYWIASGEAKVAGLTSSGHVAHFATLHAGSGFGERTYLNGGTRNADVYMSKAGVVAVLERDSMDLTDEESHWIANMVKASQQLEASPMFHGLPSMEKELWLRNAILCSAYKGDCVIAEGSPEAWMGMVVSGDALVVSRQGQLVAYLSPGDVFGEMSAWTNQTRTANLVAKGDVSFLRWNEEFWENQARQCGLDRYLDGLVNARQDKLNNTTK